MTTQHLEETALALVADGKGILAADESMRTISSRFEALGIASTPESRCAYRELLIGTPQLGQFISGVILYDETMRQTDRHGVRLPALAARVGIIPGIKVDIGAKPLAACPGEKVTEGLDGLRGRLRDYLQLGARFAKWRAVIRVSEDLPSDTCIEVNAHALARYAALCQEEGLVPIVEPEVLMEGAHSLSRAESVTGRVLERVFAALRAQRVALEGMLLKPNMVVPGRSCAERASVTAVATATVRVLLRQVPGAVPGIVFLSGGQGDREATVHLDAINAAQALLPWRVSFSYGRALQDRALATWGGDADRVQAAQAALQHRARCNSAAALGTYDASLEEDQARQPLPLH